MSNEFNEVSLPLPLRLNDFVPSAELPPIVLFTYNRPSSVLILLEALEKQTLPPSKIIAYVDGPRSIRDEGKVNQCVELLKSFEGAPIEVIARGRNYGCRDNILDGLCEVLGKYPEVVILEDDTIPSPSFYKSMCQLLTAYRPFKKVFSISGYATWPASQFARENPADRKRCEQKLVDADMVFTNRYQCWGWAVWADRWKTIESDVLRFRNPFGRLWNIPRYPLVFDLPYIFYRQATGKVQPWAIFVALETLHKGYLHLSPQRSQIKNIGYGDPEATSCKTDLPWINEAFNPDFSPELLPISLTVLPEFERQLPLWMFFLFFLNRLKDKWIFALAGKVKTG